MAESAGNWCLIESDPGVFSEMIQRFGVEDVQMEEIFDLSELEYLRPVYGLVFLFKYDAANHRAANIDHSANVFFAHQIINNACATQAILSILMNKADKLKMGESLTNFKEFTKDLPPDLRGLAISNADDIKTIHNSFARSDPFQIEQIAEDDEKEDAFHFVAYVERDGFLYELDGLQEGPVNHGACTEDEFVVKVQSVIQKRIELFGTSEIRFALMALVKSKLALLQERFEALEERIDEQAEAERAQIAMDIQTESVKWEQWKMENARRRANYLGFAITLFKEMIKKNLISV